MAASKGSELILSLNVRGLQLGGDSFNDRLTALYDYAKANPVREMHLQEVFTYGMLRELTRNLPQWQAAYKKGVTGPKGGLVSFYQERPERVKFYPLVPSLLAQLDWLGIVPYWHKGVLVTSLPNGRIRCNLHLDPNHSGDWERSNGQTLLISRQLGQITKMIRGLIQTSRPANVIVLGDFNLPHTASAYMDLVQATGLQDVFEGDDRPTFHQAFLPPGRTAHQIDHILIWSSQDAPIAPKNAQHIFVDPVRHGDREMYVSDHVGLVVDVGDEA